MKVAALLVVGSGAVTMDMDITPIARSPEFWASKKLDPCKCLNWKEVFASNKASCGMGLETFRQDLSGEDMGMPYRKSISGKWDDGLCNILYSRLNSTGCANANMGERDGQWCYVNSGCGKLNEGWRVPGKDKKWSTSVKFCTEGQDNFLKDMMPGHLSKFARDHEVDVGFLMKMAYPTVQGQKWEDVKKFWSKNRDEMEIFPRARAEEIALTSAPVVWGSKSQQSFGVTQGESAFQIDPTIVARLTADLKEVPHKLTRMTCLSGCPEKL